MRMRKQWVPGHSSGGSGLGTSSAKCVFGRSQPKFLHHIIDQEGIRADPDKTSTITEMKPPTNVSKLGCFMGMDNQLGKFSSNLAELSGNSSTRSHHGFGVLTKTRVFHLRAEGIGKANSTCSLQSSCTDQSVCWCLLLQLMSRLNAETRHRVETNFLCISTNDRNRTTLCIVPKGSPGLNMGMWGFLHLHILGMKFMIETDKQTTSH